jgi:hypothetical protein
MGLTAEEAGRIRAAHDRAAGEASWTTLAQPLARATAASAEKLAKVWYAMPEDDRAAVRAELAAICGADPHDLDVGLAADRVAGAARGRPGVQVRAPGFNAAVAEAVSVWAGRGNAVQVGNIWRDTKPGEPYPMLSFVADALLTALPPEAISLATGMRQPDRAKLLQSVDARLRA